MSKQNQEQVEPTIGERWSHKGTNYVVMAIANTLVVFRDTIEPWPVFTRQLHIWHKKMVLATPVAHTAWLAAVKAAGRYSKIETTSMVHNRIEFTWEGVKFNLTPSEGGNAYDPWQISRHPVLSFRDFHNECEELHRIVWDSHNRAKEIHNIEGRRFYG